MKLRDYLHFNELMIKDMARDLGICRSYLSSIKSGKRKCSKALAKRIEEYTGNQVTQNDMLRPTF